MVSVVGREKINGNKTGRVCCQFVSMLFGKKQGNELFFQSFCILGLIQLNFTSLYRSRRSRVFYEKEF